MTPRSLRSLPVNTAASRGQIVGRRNRDDSPGRHCAADENGVERAMRVIGDIGAAPAQQARVFGARQRAADPAHDAASTPVASASARSMMRADEIAAVVRRGVYVFARVDAALRVLRGFAKQGRARRLSL